MKTESELSGNSGQIAIPKQLLTDLVEIWNKKHHNPYGSPNHSHAIPGIWDSDNGDLAGKPCAECNIYDEARRLLSQDCALAEQKPKLKLLSDEEILEIGFSAGFAVDYDDQGQYGFLDEFGDIDNEPFLKLAKAIEQAVLKANGVIK